MTVVVDFEEVVPFDIVHWGRGPVVDDRQIEASLTQQPARQAAVGAAYGEAANSCGA